jgi:hypothetical protein
MSDDADEILALERAALERWGAGDPDGFLELSDPEVTYFDPFIERRLDGLAGLAALYNELRGKVHIDSFEMVNPMVQFAGGSAVLTFQFVSRGGEGTLRWNTTEVYHRTAAEWRIIHTHWAFAQPRLASGS